MVRLGSVAHTSAPRTYKIYKQNKNKKIKRTDINNKKRERFLFLFHTHIKKAVHTSRAPRRGHTTTTTTQKDAKRFLTFLDIAPDGRYALSPAYNAAKKSAEDKAAARVAHN